MIGYNQIFGVWLQFRFIQIFKDRSLSGFCLWDKKKIKHWTLAAYPSMQQEKKGIKIFILVNPLKDCVEVLRRQWDTLLYMTVLYLKGRPPWRQFPQNCPSSGGLNSGLLHRHRTCKGAASSLKTSLERMSNLWRTVLRLYKRNRTCKGAASSLKTSLEGMSNLWRTVLRFQTDTVPASLHAAHTGVGPKTLFFRKGF